MSDEIVEDMGDDVDPETGNFKQEELEKKIYLPFHPFEESWMQKPENKVVWDEMQAEYEQSPAEIKFLAGVCDGTVLGAYERLFLESKLGERFYELRPLEEEKHSAGDIFGGHNPESTFDIDKHYAGYHFLNSNRAMEILRNLRSNVDITQSVDINDQESIYTRIERDPSFIEALSRDDIGSIEQFATSLVVFIKGEAWQRNNERREEAGESSAGAFYSIGGSIIYAPEAMKQASDLIPALKHEYQHLIDYSIRKNLYVDGRLQMESKDSVLLNLKTEISAYIEYFDEVGVDPYELLPKIQELLKNYPYLYGTEESAKKCDDFIDSLKQSESFIKGLIKEAGLSADESKNISLFLKTFLSALPEHPIVFRMLKRLPETGLFKAGLTTS